MDSKKKKRLEAKGWKIGTVEEFLEMKPGELMKLPIEQRRLILEEAAKRMKPFYESMARAKEDIRQGRVTRIEDLDDFLDSL